MPTAWAEFVRAHTRLSSPPLVPEIRLNLADDVFALWEQAERETGRPDTPPPFWAFPWAGGQALARYLLDHPDVTTGRRVFDVGTGCGVVAIAAALAGASAVVATDTEPVAVVAAALNARANDVVIDVTCSDILGADGTAADEAEVVVGGDLCYERALAARVLDFCDRSRARGARVLLGDPGRTYFPRDRFTELASYDVPVTPALEDAETKRAAVWSPVAWPSAG